MSDERTWPNNNHYRLLMDGTPDQLENLYAFLPAVQTEEQEYFMSKLSTKLRAAHGASK